MNVLSTRVYHEECRMLVLKEVKCRHQDDSVLVLTFYFFVDYKKERMNIRIISSHVFVSSLQAPLWYYETNFRLHISGKIVANTTSQLLTISEKYVDIL